MHIEVCTMQRGSDRVCEIASVYCIQDKNGDVVKELKWGKVSPTWPWSPGGWWGGPMSRLGLKSSPTIPQ